MAESASRLRAQLANAHRFHPDRVADLRQRLHAAVVHKRLVALLADHPLLPTQTAEITALLESVTMPQT